MANQTMPVKAAPLGGHTSCHTSRHKASSLCLLFLVVVLANASVGESANFAAVHHAMHANARRGGGGGGSGGKELETDYMSEAGACVMSASRRLWEIARDSSCGKELKRRFQSAPVVKLADLKYEVGTAAKNLIFFTKLSPVTCTLPEDTTSNDHDAKWDVTVNIGIDEGQYLGEYAKKIKEIAGKLKKAERKYVEKIKQIAVELNAGTKIIKFVDEVAESEIYDEFADEVAESESYDAAGHLFDGVVQAMDRRINKLEKLRMGFRGTEERCGNLKLCISDWVAERECGRSEFWRWIKKFRRVKLVGKSMESQITCKAEKSDNVKHSLNLDLDPKKIRSIIFNLEINKTVAI